MAEQFDVAELVKISVEDEKSGAAFYAILAEKVADEQLRKTFALLTQQELGHQKRFEEMLAYLGGVKTPEEYPGQYLAYLHALTGGRAFPNPQAAERAAKNCPNDAAAIELAIRIERDTLMLYHELRGLLPEKDGDIVSQVTMEEQAHLVDLTAAQIRLGRRK